jgi:UDP-glucose 4-epimerase
VAIFCGAAARQQPVALFGNGRQTRDFIYVVDVVDAFLLAGASDAQGALNVATGVETSLLDLAGMVGVRTESHPERLGDVQRSCLDPSAAAQWLGWRARIPVDEGVARTLATLRP